MPVSGDRTVIISTREAISDANLIGMASSTQYVVIRAVLKNMFRLRQSSNKDHLQKSWSDPKDSGGQGFKDSSEML